MAAELKQALFEHLSANATIAAIVGARIVPNVAPTTATTGTTSASFFPYLAYERLSSDHVRHAGGPSGLAQGRMQIECWGLDSVTVESLADAVRRALQNFIGNMGAIALPVYSTLVDSMGDTVKFPETAADPIKWNVSVNVSIWYRESTT